ncbi:MAG TPA: DUF2782 domain-containing protein [Noviherbaspirillum sp.]|nr:DUF2782 domain-containing protein [Noviherbaspirillum sp.]
MRTIKLWPVVAACITSSAFSLSAWAQQANDAPPPPKMEKLEEGEAPTVTIRKPDQERKVTEKRAPGGKVTEVKVTNGKSTYYLKPNDPAGSAVAGDTQTDTTRPAQWRVMEFDVVPTQEIKEAEAAQAPAVPPPAAPAKK